LTELRPGKSVVRRIGKLCVRIDADGIAVRGRRKRRWRHVTWADLIRLACKLNPPAEPGWTAEEWLYCERTIGAK